MPEAPLDLQAETASREYSVAAQRLTPLQRAALIVLLIAAGVAFAFGGFILWGWITQGPVRPDFAGLQGEALQAALERYRTLVAMHDTRFEKMFTVVVLSAVVPIITLLLGYLFGRNFDGDG